MPAIFLILVCIIGAGIAVVLFGGWLVYTIFRVVASAVESLAHGHAPRATFSQQSPPGWICQRMTCRAGNPSHARFCRRCGRAVAGETVKAKVAVASI